MTSPPARIRADARGTVVGALLTLLTSADRAQMRSNGDSWAQGNPEHRRDNLAPGTCALPPLCVKSRCLGMTQNNHGLYALRSLSSTLSSTC